MKQPQPEPLVEQNIKSVSIFAILNLVLIYAIVIGLPYTQSLPSLLNALLTSVTAMSIAGIVVVVISGMASPEFKGALITWSRQYPMPAYRAFTDAMLADSRFTKMEFETKLKTKIKGGAIPTAGIGSNEAWYEIYKRHESAPSVMQAQKAYLLTTEMAFIAFIAAVLTTAIWLVLSIFPKLYAVNEPLLPYAILFVIQYLVVARAANTYGVNFVRNVLAEESV